MHCPKPLQHRWQQRHLQKQMDSVMLMQQVQRMKHLLLAAAAMQALGHATQQAGQQGRAVQLPSQRPTVSPTAE